MLKKLLKYDLKWCFKSLVVFYILALLFSLIVRIIESFELNLMLLIIDKVCCGIVIGLLVAILVNCFIINWMRFIRNIYKDESYLTHTLPVSKNKIFLAKVLTASITLFVSLIVILVSLAISTLSKESWLLLKDSLEQSALFFNSSVFSLITVLVMTIFFEFLFMILCGILGIIIGHKANSLKILRSIVFGVFIYSLLSSLSIGALFIAGLLNPDIMSIFNNIVVSSESLKGMLLVGSFIYIIYILLVSMVGNKLLNKGVNVD